MKSFDIIWTSLSCGLNPVSINKGACSFVLFYSSPVSVGLWQLPVKLSDKIQLVPPCR